MAGIGLVGNAILARRAAVTPTLMFRYVRGLIRQGSFLPLIFAAAAVNAVAGYVALEATRLDLREFAAARATAYANAIANTVLRSAVVPQVLAQDQDVRTLLDTPEDLESARLLNRRLEHVAAQIGAEAVYVMNDQGLTLASSNWNTPGNFIGRNFRFRPYFTEVMSGRPSQYIALGTTTNRLGYYLSYPVLSGSQVVGVLVAKLGPDLLERDWMGAPDIMLMTDESGVVLLTNRPSWRFHTVNQLSNSDRANIMSSQRYPGQELLPLSLDIHDDSAVVHAGADAGNYLVAMMKLADSRSVIYVLATAEPTWSRAVNIVVLTVASLTLLSAGYIFLHRRRIAVRLRIHREQRVREALEQCVTERTAALTTANRRLREVQGDLIQSAKLATLGQMSASLAHELSQPVVAMRGFAENGLILLERGRYSELNTNLVELIAMTSRMAGITKHLKAFSRRGPGDLDKVQLTTVAAECLSLMAARIRELSVHVTVDIPDCLKVYAGQVRLEQVMLNLLQNACDALSSVPDRAISIVAEQRQSWTWLSVRDNGPGIAPEILPRLFEGFMTTKPVDQGLGLGLSISRDIVEEFGGSIEASSLPGGGAVFVVKLRSAA